MSATPEQMVIELNGMFMRLATETEDDAAMRRIKTARAAIDTIRAQAERVRVLESEAQAARSLEASVAEFLDAYTAFNNDELDEVSMNDAEHAMKLAMYAFRKAREGA